MVEPGLFATKVVADNLTKLPVHPAYTNPKLNAHATRVLFENVNTVGADATKAVERFYDLAHLSDPPLRFVIGTNAAASVRNHLKGILAEVDKYESWSEGLEVEVGAKC